MDEEFTSLKPDPDGCAGAIAAIFITAVVIAIVTIAVVVFL